MKFDTCTPFHARLSFVDIRCGKIGSPNCPPDYHFPAQPPFAGITSSTPFNYLHRIYSSLTCLPAETRFLERTHHPPLSPPLSVTPIDSSGFHPATARSPTTGRGVPAQSSRISAGAGTVRALSRNPILPSPRVVVTAATLVLRQYSAPWPAILPNTLYSAFNASRVLVLRPRETLS